MLRDARLLATEELPTEEEPDEKEDENNGYISDVSIDCYCLSG